MMESCISVPRFDKAVHQKTKAQLAPAPELAIINKV